MKKVLVTGAHGFIGRHVSRLYGQKGWHVTGIGHGMWDRKEWEECNIAEWHTCDIELDFLRTYAGEPDVIIHCAGGSSVGFSMKHPLQDFERNVQTTARILDFVRTHAPKARVVLTSSAAVYGNSKALPISEDIPLLPVSPYGMHKKMSEELCLSYARNFGIATIIVRLFSVYGKGLRKQILWDACTKLAGNERSFFGTGNETRDLLHVSDAAELLFVAAEHASRECPAVNGGTGNGIAIKTLLKEIFSSFQRNEQPVFIGRNRQGDPFHYEADISRARSLGWEPAVAWQSGIRDYVEWFRSLAS